MPTYVPTQPSKNVFDIDVDSARAVMEAAEAKMIEDPMNQKALDRLLEAQATYEAVGGLTQDRLVAQVQHSGSQSNPCSLRFGRCYGGPKPTS